MIAGTVRSACRDFSRRHYLFRTQPVQLHDQLRVENLDELLKALREEGVAVDPKVEDYDYGKFGWITDPEGNRIELWELKTAISG